MFDARLLFTALALAALPAARAAQTAAARPVPAAPDPAEEARASLGSPYVPLDSWVYGVLDRLASFGLIPSQTSGLRPWTRAECRRQALEAEALLQKSLGDYSVQQRTDELSPLGEQAAELISALRRELDPPDSATPSVTLQSVYTRNGVIAGPALTDSFHFGQTWTGDNGRPFGRGWNSYTGFTARAESGRFFAYVEGEYQHAPGRDPYSLPVRQTIATLDAIPLQAAEPRSDTDRFRTIEAYAGLRLGDVEFSLGKQALWWGPTYDEPLSFSNNAEPTKNLKISTVNPFGLPGPLRLFGDMRLEFVMGKLGGQKYTWRPWFNAQKITFKLTENLEMGFTRWSIFWGVGHPMTVGSFFRNFVSLNSPLGPSGVGATDPGDRKGGFDFRYRIPGLRNWLTLYSDSYCDDDPSPLANPRRAAISPGIYLTRVPLIPKLDFRVEAISTTPMGGDQGGFFLYYNDQYHSGNTNYGYLLGNAAGRDGRAIEAWTTYWLSARARVQAEYRQFKGGAKFLPGGATQSDATLRTSFGLGRDWHADLMLQYERFWVPLLGGPATNRSGYVQLTWEPNLQILNKGTNRN